jgi:3',5'-cyclic AMP phosphodiesterase CpdA
MLMDEIDDTSRRGLLKCMLWAGSGLIWTVAGGIPRSSIIGSIANAATTEGFSFAQISDSHIGFSRDPNTDTPGTLAAACELLKAAPQKPSLVLHTGDVSHLSKEAEFDTAEKIIGAAGFEMHYVPGEHDWIEADGKPFVARFQKGTQQSGEGGYYSFDQEGVHFVGLNNVANLKAGGLGDLGDEQLVWLENDLKGRSASQPIVLFAHIPLWTVYEKWGWGTEDGGRALELTKRFGSVTVLNGHIHQIMQKVEGNVAFHTARATAFPQPAPGTASSPGPMKVDPGKLRSYLGITNVSVVRGQERLAIVDTPLGA